MNKFSMYVRALAIFKNITYIQIGGNDGCYADPLYPIIKSHPNVFLRGDVYEPHPLYFDKLSKNLAAYDFVQPHNKAVISDGEDFNKSLYYIDPEDIIKFKLPEWSQGIASFFYSNIMPLVARVAL